MTPSKPKLALIALSLVLGGTMTTLPAKIAAQGPANCDGCDGSGTTSQTTTYGTQTVSISVITVPGACFVTDPVINWCDAFSCSAKITRTWSGLSPNSNFDFCVSDSTTGRTACRKPSPTTGTGSGTDEDSMAIHCDASFIASIVYGTEPGSLKAQAPMECTPCTGN